MPKLVAPSLRPSDPFMFRLEQYAQELREEQLESHAQRLLDLAVAHTGVEALYFYLGKTRTSYGSSLEARKFKGVKYLTKFAQIAGALQIHCDEDESTLIGLQGSLRSLHVLYPALSAFYPLSKAKELEETIDRAQDKCWLTYIDQLAKQHVWQEIHKLHQQHY